MKRSGAKRYSRSIATEIPIIDRDINTVSNLQRHNSTTSSIQSTVFTLWTPSIPLPSTESTHILEELVSSEAAYLTELQSIHTNIIRPHRIARISTSVFLAQPHSPHSSSKRHSRSGSLFSIRSDKTSSSPVKGINKNDHLDSAFHGIESMIKSHSQLLTAFVDSKTPYSLLSAFIVQVPTLVDAYSRFVRDVPHLTDQLPAANDSLPNKLSGYSRFLTPVQRIVKYELLLRRLAQALYTEQGCIELQELTKSALRCAVSLCQALETSQRAEENRQYLSELTKLLGTDVSEKTVLFDGSIHVDPLSSRKVCKFNYAVAFTDTSIFWSNNERKRPWTEERVTKVEEGGHLDIIVHTTRKGKSKPIRRAVQFNTTTRPLCRSSTTVQDVIQPLKRARKESVIDVWMDLNKRRVIVSE